MVTQPLEQPHVVIIGAGLAGLACAGSFQRLGLPYTVIEAQPTIGGRVQTDEVEGFLLDRGFQVLLSSYEEVRMQVPWEMLEAQPFNQGAVLASKAKGLQPFLDPTHHAEGWKNLLNPPLGDTKDVAQLGFMKLWYSLLSEEQTLNTPERSTLDALKAKGFSEATLERFFKPFFGGVFLDSDLGTSVKKFRWAYHYFATGQACLPSGGMRTLPRLLAEDLPESRFWLDKRVAPLNPEAPMQTADGEPLQASHVVLATDIAGAAYLLNEPLPTPTHTAEVWYFAAESLPEGARPALYLADQREAAEQQPAILHWCFPSLVNSGYAPEGQHLVSVTTCARQRDCDELAYAESIKGQLGDYFKTACGSWRFLRRYWETNALPATTQRYGHGNLTPLQEKAKAYGVTLAGDYLETASIQGALKSGRQAAMCVYNAVKRTHPNWKRS